MNHALAARNNDRNEEDVPGDEAFAGERWVLPFHQRQQQAGEGNDDENGNAVPVIPEEHRIESFEQWLQANALPSHVAEEEDRWERRHDCQRVAAAQAYQQAVHQQAFGEYQRNEQEARAQKEAQLQAWKGKRLTITCRDDRVVENVDLVPMAAVCDTIFALAASWRHFNSSENTDDEKDVENEQNRNNHDDATLLLNLPDYHVEVVQVLIDIVVQNKSLQDIERDDIIVELCQLANYVQHTALLQETVQILLQSIDSANCLAITQLADQLHLPRLFEAALQHMMQSVHNLEDGDCWDDLTPELRERIAAIQSAIQSSIHDQRSALYFGSLQEYIAIFAERVHYYKERLAEAVEQQARLPQTPAWYDAQRKIERQRARLHTLQVAFAEQKKLFGAKHWQ